MEADFRLNRARSGKKTLECALDGIKQPLLDKALKTRTTFKNIVIGYQKWAKKRKGVYFYFHRTQMPT